MEPSVKFLTSNNGCSGFVVRPNPALPYVAPLEPESHAHRAVWLTAQLEAASWSTVSSDDGAAMSAGLIHNVAVFPGDLSQGSLWRVVYEVLEACHAAGKPATKLSEHLRLTGWHVSPDGVLRDFKGAAVPGKIIREAFTGPEGKAPPSGPQHENAKEWALDFQAAFAEPAGYRAQAMAAIRWLAGGDKADELQVYRRFSGQPGLDSWIGLTASALGPDIDLALCVYHSFSVNAPAVAAKCLRQVLSLTDPELFSRRLIRTLGLVNFGRWRDRTDDQGDRYDRCRIAAHRLWPSDLVNRLMPKDL